MSQEAGVVNKSRQKPFLLVPSEGTIKAQENYEVKVTFQPDHPQDNYFDILLIDIPNQINAKKIYLRGWAYGRQFFARENDPFVWKAEGALKKKFEEPLVLIQAPGHNHPAAPKDPRPQVLLEFARDEEVEDEKVEFEKVKNRERSILIGNCRLLDTKMAKAGNFEITPPQTSAKYFECDMPKGTVQGGQEQVVKLLFHPPPTDRPLQDIGPARGTGHRRADVHDGERTRRFRGAGAP